MTVRTESDYGLDLAVVAIATYIVTDDFRATTLLTVVHGLVHYVGYSMSKRSSEEARVAASY